MVFEKCESMQPSVVQHIFINNFSFQKLNIDTNTHTHTQRLWEHGFTGDVNTCLHNGSTQSSQCSATVTQKHTQPLMASSMLTPTQSLGQSGTSYHTSFPPRLSSCSVTINELVEGWVMEECCRDPAASSSTTYIHFTVSFHLRLMYFKRTVLCLTIALLYHHFFTVMVGCLM